VPPSYDGVQRTDAAQSQLALMPEIARADIFCLYHWSPVRNRGQIKRYGLRPLMWSRDREWKPPYICFSENPALAWQLSGHDDGPQDWDLWMTYSDVASGMEAITDTYPDTGITYVKEWRVYERIYK
jgi:hypothetical protein